MISENTSIYRRHLSAQNFARARFHSARILDLWISYVWFENSRGRTPHTAHEKTPASREYYGDYDGGTQPMLKPVLLATLTPSQAKPSR